jgi:putative membrane protein
MLWVLAFHIVFVVSWFAGLFYLPRLFVYHAQCIDAVGNARFKIMERKLLMGIMLPMSILVLVTGVWLLWGYAWTLYKTSIWLQAKLALVFLLYIYFGFCWKYVLDFKHDRNRHTHIFFRWFNEVPLFFLLTIVILVIVKPF